MTDYYAPETYHNFSPPDLDAAHLNARETALDTAFDDVATDIAALGAGFQIGTHAARLALGSPATGLLFKESDTGVVYVYDGAAWQIWNASGKVVKSTIQTVQNNTVQDDNELFWPMEVNESWFVRAFLMTSAASANADWRFTFNGPTGVTGGWDSFLSGHFVPVGTGSSPNVMQTLNNAGSFGAVAGTQEWMLMAWLKTNGSNAGNAKLRWAQNTTTAENNSVLAGSWLEPVRLS